MSAIKKTITQVWTQKVCDNNNYWGLGDMIRGTISLYLLSKKYNCDFDVCIMNHPISQYLTYKSKYDDLLKDKNIEFREDPEEYIKDKLSVNNSENLIFLMTNKYCFENLDDFIIDKMKKVLTPIDEINNSVDSIIKNFKIKKIIHMRVGDEYINNNFNTDKYVSFLKNNKCDLFLTDSNILKNHAKTIVNTLDFKVGHAGYEKDSEILKNTLIEFFIVSRASEIHTFTKYHWISGFVNWTSQIYKIKLVIIKQI